MAMEKNKVKFGLNKVHYAKITSYDDEGVPTFAKPVRIPGAVSLSIDAEGEASNFYADDGVYYVINNNSGYTGDLEIALVPLEFATDDLGEFFVVLCFRQTFAVRIRMIRAFSRKPILQKYHSLHCCLNSAAIRIKFGTVCSVVLPLVRQQNPAPLRTKRKLKQKRCL